MTELVAASARAQIAGVILSGGKSRRMGGGDKTLLQISGVTLLETAIARLGPQVETLAINANGDASRFAAFGLPVITDSIPGYAGPLAGVLAAMDWAAKNVCLAVATIAGDTPFFPDDLVARLQSGLNEGKSRIAVAASRGRQHPIFGLWDVSLRDELRRHLHGAGSARVTAFIEAHPFSAVEFQAENPDAVDPFFNINTSDDLIQAKRFASSF